jgi:Gram-negative bacterial TonB protein C-terminal
MRSVLLLVILAVGICSTWSTSRILAQAPTTQDPNKPRRIRLGGDVHPVVKHRVEPKYPKEAIEHGLEGDVQAMVLFGIDGLVKDVKILSGDASLAQSVSTAFMPLCN